MKPHNLWRSFDASAGQGVIFNGWNFKKELKVPNFDQSLWGAVYKAQWILEYYSEISTNKIATWHSLALIVLENKKYEGAERYFAKGNESNFSCWLLHFMHSRICFSYFTAFFIIVLKYATSFLQSMSAFYKISGNFLKKCREWQMQENSHFR